MKFVKSKRSMIKPNLIHSYKLRFPQEHNRYLTVKLLIDILNHSQNAT